MKVINATEYKNYSENGEDGKFYVTYFTKIKNPNNVIYQIFLNGTLKWVAREYEYIS